MDVNSLVYEKKVGGECSSPNESSLALIRSEGSSHTATKQDVVRCSLDQLPIGILHKVVDHLDLVALVCLQSSNRHFYTSISIDPSLLSVCIRWRIHVHFWNDRRNERLEKACMLCKTKRKHQRSQDGDERLVIEGPAKSCSKGHIKSSIIRVNITPDRSATDKLEWTLTDPTTALFYKIPEPSKSLVESYVDYTLDHIYHFTYGHPRRLDPRCLYRWYKLADGLCYDHLMEQFGTNETIEALLPLIQVLPKSAWLRFTVLRCLHCGKCVEEGDSRLHGCLNCCCDVCHRRISHQHYRTGPRQTQNPQLRRILGDELGSLWIYEVGNKHPVPVLLPLSRAGSGKLDPEVVYYAESARTVHPAVFWEPNTQQKLPQIPPKIEIIHARAQGPAEKSEVESMTTYARMGGTTEK